MKIGITGSTGNIGSQILAKLLEDKRDVNVLVRSSSRLSKEVIKKVNIYYGDITNEEALLCFLSEVDTVLHIAGKAHDPSGKEADYFQVNYEGTILLSNVAKMQKVKKIIYLSTIMVYGKSENKEDDENTPCMPKDAYGISKLRAEEVLLKEAKKGSYDAVVFRLPVVYGPYDKGNVKRLIKAISKKRFFYFGKGLAKRSMIYSQNIVDAVWLALEEKCGAGGQVFCVKDQDDYTIVYLVNTICEELGIKWRPLHVPLFVVKVLGWCGDVAKIFLGNKVPIDSDRVLKLSSSLTFSSEKIKNDLGYKPPYTLRDGIREEVRWMREEGII
ncbi:MAG: NAD-dependent epimerase/dehydratase family protein [Candidatus Ancaeobacter aquaticus]|nr:NAD-dependent epimerase/dehydratase family protein [Candidatus Ancaeobacter aquaticus]